MTRSGMKENIAVKNKKEGGDEKKSWKCEKNSKQFQA